MSRLPTPNPEPVSILGVGSWSSGVRAGGYFFFAAFFAPFAAFLAM
jgi:hypothetical protein